MRKLVGKYLGTILYLSVVIGPALLMFACSAIIGAGK